MSSIIKLRKVELSNYWDFDGKYTIQFKLNRERNITFITYQCLTGADSLFKGMRWGLTGSGEGKYCTLESGRRKEAMFSNYPEAHKPEKVKAYLHFEKNGETLRIGRTAKPVDPKKISFPIIKKHKISVDKKLKGKRSSLEDPETYFEQHFNPDAMELFNIDTYLIWSFRKKGARRNHVKTALRFIEPGSRRWNKQLVDRFTERINKHFRRLQDGDGDCPTVVIGKGYEIGFSIKDEIKSYDSVIREHQYGLIFSFLTAFWEMTWIDQPTILFDPFFNLDDRYMLKVGKLIGEVSLRRQVILFTKRDDIYPVIREHVSSILGTYFVFGGKIGAGNYKYVQIENIKNDSMKEVADKLKSDINY